MKKYICLAALIFTAVLSGYAQADDPSFTFEKTTVQSEESRSFGFESRPGEHPAAQPQTQKTATASTAPSSGRRAEKRAGIREPGRWSIGGGLGLSFGSDYSSVTVSPQAGYRINNYLMVGGGFSYNYFRDTYYDYSLNYLGANLFARIYPIRYISLLVQPEIYRRWGTVRQERTGSDVFGSLLLGGGVVIPINRFSSFNITLYYDVLQNDYSPHGNRIGYSVGYTFGF